MFTDFRKKGIDQLKKIGSATLITTLIISNIVGKSNEFKIAQSYSIPTIYSKDINISEPLIENLNENKLEFNINNDKPIVLIIDEKLSGHGVMVEDIIKYNLSNNGIDKNEYNIVNMEYIGLYHLYSGKDIFDKFINGTLSKYNLIFYLSNDKEKTALELTNKNSIEEYKKFIDNFKTNDIVSIIDRFAQKYSNDIYINMSFGNYIMFKHNIEVLLNNQPEIYYDINGERHHRDNSIIDLKSIVDNSTGKSLRYAEDLVEVVKKHPNLHIYTSAGNNRNQLKNYLDTIFKKQSLVGYDVVGKILFDELFVKGIFNGKDLYQKLKNSGYIKDSWKYSNSEMRKLLLLSMEDLSTNITKYIILSKISKNIEDRLKVVESISLLTFKNNYELAKNDNIDIPKEITKLYNKIENGKNEYEKYNNPEYIKELDKLVKKYNNNIIFNRSSYDSIILGSSIKNKNIGVHDYITLHDGKIKKYNGTSTGTPHLLSTDLIEKIVDNSQNIDKSI